MRLKISNLFKTYPNGVRALKCINLNISPGMYGLIGPNGSGKSSLMRTLATLQDPDQGEVFFNGLNVIKNKGEMRKTLGYLPQEFGVYPRVSAEDLLDYLATLKGFYQHKERKKVVQSLLKITNLLEFRKRKILTFSGGMKQRFGIAQALIGNPKLIIVDEPTAGLDPEERLRFYNVLNAVGKNSIIILSTHIVEDVAQLCQKFAILNEGQILVESETEKALESLNKKIWSKILERDQIKSLSKEVLILSRKLKMGKIEVRVFSETCPQAGFKEVSPILEDFYFSYIKGFAHKSFAHEDEGNF